jgi:DNA-binding XRE family transcriptional regulator
MKETPMISLHERMGEPVGDQIRKARNALNITRERLAYRSGVSMHTICKIEHGKNATWEKLAALSKALGMALVIGEDDDYMRKYFKNLVYKTRPRMNGMKHGTPHGYKKGCRCSRCSRAHSEYKKVRRLKQGKKVQAPLPPGYEHMTHMITTVGTKVSPTGK